MIYLGTVSTVDATARTVQVLVRPMGLLSGPLRVASPFGLVAPLPVVGDEVLILAPLHSLADAVAVGWIPTGGDASGAAGHPLIASAAGGVPTQVDPSQDVGNAETSGVLTR